MTSPIIAEDDVGHILQLHKGISSNPVNVIPGDDESLYISRKTLRHHVQILRDAFHSASDGKTLAPGGALWTVVGCKGHNPQKQSECKKSKHLGLEADEYVELLQKKNILN